MENRPFMCVTVAASAIPVLSASLGVLLLPLAPVERLDRHLFHRARVQAARVDAQPVGMRARHVEGLDAADRAEQVLRDAGVESVVSQRVPAADEGEAVGGNNEVQVAGLAAD